MVGAALRDNAAAEDTAAGRNAEGEGLLLFMLALLRIVGVPVWTVGSGGSFESSFGYF